MPDSLNNLVVFLSIGIIGAIVETASLKIYYQITKKQYKEHHFTFSKYSLLLLLPFVSLILLATVQGASILKVFILFSLFGPICEWFTGFFYHKIVGVRLWTYHRYAITGYTSLLTIPLWGFGGVLFFLISKLFRTS